MLSNLIFLSNESVNTDVLLSFIIPTYKNRKFLISAIDSILSQDTELNDTVEIIVVSNNTEDSMEDLIDRYHECKIQIKLYRNQENYGQVGNINQGVSLAKGKYVSFIHDDDLILPNFLTEMCEYIENPKQDYPCIVPSFYMMDETYHYDLKHRIMSAIFGFRFLYRHKIQIIRPQDCIRTFHDVYSAPTCGTIFLKKAIIEYGFFKNERGAAWDYYNYRQFNKIYDVYLLHRFVGIRRTETGMSNEEKVQREFQEDRKQMAEIELKNNKYIQKYKSAILTKKPFLKYLFFRVKAGIYFYTHNLDSKLGISKQLFTKYGKMQKDSNI